VDLNSAESHRWQGGVSAVRTQDQKPECTAALRQEVAQSTVHSSGLCFFCIYKEVEAAGKKHETERPVITCTRGSLSQGRQKHFEDSWALRN
jgi:hypothetical protein